MLVNMDHIAPRVMDVVEVSTCILLPFTFPLTDNCHCITSILIPMRSFRPQRLLWLPIQSDIDPSTQLWP